jgi:hypothetical protein
VERLCPDRRPECDHFRLAGVRRESFVIARRLSTTSALLLGLSVFTPIPAAHGDSGPLVPQGVQSDSGYAASFAAHHVRTTTATTGQTSCYRPEVPYATSDGPVDGYSGMTPCPGASTGEDTGATGPYGTQAGSNPGYPAATSMLVKDHSESDIRVDPTNPNHLIGSSKWIVSPEGYNHLLGFYESFDGGQTWPVSGHIPGYEGYTDNTDPIGAFDRFGNYYSLILPYQFFYRSDGTHNFTVGTSQEPDPAVPSQVISAAVRPHGATAATDWISTHDGHPDLLASYDSIGNGPDKQWLTIDTNPASPHRDRIYAMWVDFHTPTAVPYVSWAQALPDGTHTDWSAPQKLPAPPDLPQGVTYLLPTVAPDGTVYTTITNTDPTRQYCCDNIAVIASTDGGVTWSVRGTVQRGIAAPPSHYANTTFRDGIENTFTVGATPVNGSYPLYSAYEDYRTGVDNVLLTASYDGGATWTNPIQVNDNASPVDEFQPNLTTAPDGTVSVAFYDRRLPCAAAGTAEAAGQGLALDTANPVYSGPLPPYGAANYCVNTSTQFYTPTLSPIGHNIRTSAHGFDPQLNSPHTECASCTLTFLGDYYGNTVASYPTGAVAVTTSVTTYDVGDNPDHRQQQQVALIPIP